MKILKNSFKSLLKVLQNRCVILKNIQKKYFNKKKSRNIGEIENS